MPTGSVSTDLEILSTTLHDLASDYVDGNFKRLAFMGEQEAVLGKGKPTFGGGAQMLQPIEVDVHSNITDLTGDGYREIDLSVRSIMDHAKFEPASFTRPVVISREERMLQGDKAVVDLWDSRLQNVMNNFMRDAEKQVFGGKVAALSSLNTLNGGEVATGFFEANAFGSQTNVVGTVSRAAYAGVPQLQHQYGTGAGDFSTNGYIQLVRLAAALEAYGLTEKGCWFASQAAYGNLKLATRQYEQYSPTESQTEHGRFVTMWNGRKIVLAPFLSEAANFSMVFVPFEHIHLKFYKDGGFDGCFGMDDVERVSRFKVDVATINLRAQLVWKAFASAALLYNADTY